MLQNIERLFSNFRGDSLRPGNHLRNRPSCIIGLEVAAGFPEPHILLYHPPLPHSNPQPAGTCCLGQSSRGAGPSSRLGLGTSEFAHKTPFPESKGYTWNPLGGSKYRWAKIHHGPLSRAPGNSFKTPQETRPPSGALDESQILSQ